MNQWRSPTAKKIYADDARLTTRSRGTSHKAKKQIGSQDIRWADLIFVMVDKHLKRLKNEHAVEINQKEIHSWLSQTTIN